MASVRHFSKGVSSDSSDSEAENEEKNEKKKGRFFKFIEKAEKLDKIIKLKPDEAKKVSKPGEVEKEDDVIFDADEIEISFADQVSERAILEELAVKDPV